MSMPPRFACFVHAMMALGGWLSVVGICAAIPPASPTGAESALLDGELQKTLLTAGIRPDLRIDRQRPIDPRIIRLETLGIDGSGLFQGRRYEARNAHEVEALSQRLLPGDRLILVGSDWANAVFVFGGVGTMEAPILVTADPGASPMSGASAVAFHGSHLVIMNLTLRGGVVADAVPDASLDAPPGPNGPLQAPIKNLFRLGIGNNRPAENCIVHGLTIENVNARDPQDWPKAITRYLRIDGTNNTVAQSTFSSLMHYGEIIGTGEMPSDRLQRLHLLNNRFIRRPRLDTDPSPYRYKIIQIGWHDLHAAPAGSLIQGNLFEDCASHVELVSIKVSDVFLRGNRFVRCPGAVNIRMGDRALVQNNLFDGENHQGTGGLRVSGRDHAIIGNLFLRLRPDEYSHMYQPPAPPTRYLAWTLSLVVADHETSGFTDANYGRADTILISHNRFESCSGRIVIGGPIPGNPSVQLLPRNIRIEHNWFSGDAKKDALFDYVAVDPNGAPIEEVFAYNNHFEP